MIQRPAAIKEGKGKKKKERKLRIESAGNTSSLDKTNKGEKKYGKQSTKHATVRRRLSP